MIPSTRLLFSVAIFLMLDKVTGTTPVISVIHSGGELFEGPHWSIIENTLYWVDQIGQDIYRMNMTTGTVESRHIEYGIVSLVVTVKDRPNIVLITSRSEVYLLDWNATEENSQNIKALTAFDIGLPKNRCDDGKVDALGRLWVGTMGELVNDTVPDSDTASFYMLDQYNFMKPDLKIRPVTVSNGIAWSRDNKQMYYIDSPTLYVDVMDFNLETAKISNRTHLFGFTENNIPGVPDGMTIDTDGNLWVACYNGGRVLKINPKTKKLLDQIIMPVTKVSSVLFGGANMSTLFVTTSRLGLTDADLLEQPEAGSLFAIEGTGSQGWPEHQFIFSHNLTYFN